MTATIPTGERRRTHGTPLVRRGFAALYGVGALIHTGFALFRPTIYRPFADGSRIGWVRDGWHDVFMAEPRLWALVLAAAELTIAVLLLRSPRPGYLAVIGFTVALALFGWGFLIWCVPALALATVSMLMERKAGRW